MRISWIPSKSPRYIIFLFTLLIFGNTLSFGQNSCTDLMKFGIYDEYNTTTDRQRFELAKSYVCSSKFSSFSEATQSASKSKVDLSFLEILTFGGGDEGQISVQKWGQWSERFCKADYNEVRDNFSFMSSIRVISPTLMSVVKACFEGIGSGLKAWITPDKDRTSFVFSARYVPVGSESAKIEAPTDFSPVGLKKKCIVAKGLESGKTLTAATQTITCNGLDPLQTYIITVHTKQGDAVGRIERKPPLPTATLAGSPTQIKRGNATTLTWTSSNAEKFSIQPSNEKIINFNSPTGTIDLRPNRSTSYNLHAFSTDDEFITSPVNIDVFVPAPTIAFTGSSSNVAFGRPFTLSWKVQDAIRVIIDQGLGEVGFNDSRTVNPTSSTTYTLTAFGDGESTTKSVSINVTPKIVFYEHIDYVGASYGSNADSGDSGLLGSTTGVQVFTDQWILLEGLRFVGFTMVTRQLLIKGPMSIPTLDKYPFYSTKTWNDVILKFSVISEAQANVLKGSVPVAN